MPKGCVSDIPTFLRDPASARLAWPAMLLATIAIFVLGLIHLGFSPLRMLTGVRELGWITMMMLPPNPGSSLPTYLQALGETLSIALLGTTLACLSSHCRSACSRRRTSCLRASSASPSAVSSIPSAASIR